jgi:hypothetical protein
MNGRHAPVAMGHSRDQALVRQAPAVAPGQVGGGAGLVEEHEPRRVHERLPGAPPPTLAGDVGPVLLRRPLPAPAQILSTVEPGPHGWLLVALGSLLPMLVGQALKAREPRHLLSGGAVLVEPSGRPVEPDSVSGTRSATIGR